MLLQPGTSTATGLARYTCLPASTAARACSGWKYGGVSMIDAVQLRADHLFVCVGAVVRARGLDLELRRGGVQVLPDHVGQRHDSRTGELGEKRADPVAASAAPDESEFDGGVRLVAEDGLRLQKQKAGCGRGPFQEIAASRVIGCFGHFRADSIPLQDPSKAGAAARRFYNF